ncbi:hypothetical protein RND81_14G086100 [Saponaria officinalis]|uniref:Uncharacterized protein n=1 Tax=Saponaria officinalis TaxID=3572 RepID=A0AAW1GMT7_SAPOF
MAASDVASAVQLIGSLLIQEGSSLYGVEEHVQGLQEELEFMQQYLQDADSKQEEREVCALVRQVRKLAYDAEDVIDTYILKVGLKNGNWFMRFVDLVYKFPQIYEVREQIQVIQASLKRVSDKLNSHGVRRITNLERGLLSREDGYRRQRPRSYPYDDNVGDFVVGMEDDIRKLTDIVMGEGSTQVGIVSIVGMGGSGKTTLARKLYNHPYAKECFDCSAWVFISQEWSTQHILSEILRKVVGFKQTTTVLGVEELVDKIRCILEKNSYLVVLDDVWRKEALELILPALPQGGSAKKGSKIIITSRNREIVKFQVTHPDHMYIHEPQPLSEKSSWELFSKIALSHRENYDKESFKNLGKDMLRECDGLPLAIIALAGILNTRGTIGEWHEVAEAVRSRILEGRCGNMYGRVGELLALSYDDLPYDLKPCFLYLSVFPEDHQISVGMLTRMWIAEVLISTQYTDLSLEDVALQRVEDLSHRFMIQVVRTNFMGAIKSIRLHDLLRDLSVQKAKEQSFLQIYTPFSSSESSHLSSLAIQPRRAAVHSSTALSTHISHLRSLIQLTQSTSSHSSYNCAQTLDVQIVSQNFKLLRVLSIWGIKMVSRVLPKQIGCLIHLRYLAIRATNITALPSSIGGLTNLRTLDYRDIHLENDLEKENIQIKIPDVFQKFVLLRHLFLPVECPWSVQELKLSSMRNLRTLWGVRLDNSSSYFMKEVPKLSTTLRKLKIVVSSENELKAAFYCPSLLNDVLHTFHCDVRDGLVISNVAPLCARKHLLKLTLIGEIQIKLSLILPVNLVRLRLKDSLIEDADPMEALGALAHLKLLSLSNAYVGTTLSCSSGSFPQLEELNVDSLLHLDKWEINYGAMPCLKKLEITKCGRLKYLPLGLNFVTTLEQLEFLDMPNAFRKQATACGWAPQNLRLPHNVTSIIKHSDSPVDSSSISKLCEQLTKGIFLDNKTKKFWVTKQHGSYVNGFMVYASGLRLSLKHFWKFMSEDIEQSGEEMKDCSYVEWKEVIESPDVGTMVMVAKLKSTVPAAYYRVVGKFDLGNLSVNVAYEIYWFVMFEESEDAFERSRHINQRSVPGKRESQRRQRRQREKERSNRMIVERIIVDEFVDATTIYATFNGREMHREIIIDKRLNEWIHIRGGELETDATMEGEVCLSLLNEKGDNHSDVVIKGFIIQPKM